MARGERHGLYINPERRARGEKHGNSKLTELQVVGIMARWLQGALQWQIALEFGIHKTTVSLIVNGKAWRHVFEEREK